MSDTILAFSISVLTGFFAVMNAITNIPKFLESVSGEKRETKRRIAAKSCLTAFLIVASFVFFGKYIFELLT